MKKIIGLFEEYQEEIKRYCDNNGLDFTKLQNMSKSYSKDILFFQYFNKNANHSNKGLNDETPSPVVLFMHVENSKVRFEQTEFTQKYLANSI